MSEWQEVKLLNASILLVDGDRGVNYPKEKDFSNSGYCLFLNAKNVTKNGFKFDVCMFIDENKDKSLGGGKLNRNDIIITTRGTVGNIAFFDESIKQDQIRINSGMVILRNFNSGLDNKYLKYFLLSDDFLQQTNRVVFGSAQPQLTIKTINNFIIRFPVSTTEQQKITHILSSVDAVIEKTGVAIAKYKAIKAGMMHDLFTRGIAENGQLRPAYQDAPHLYKDSKLGWIPMEWEVNELITVAKDNQYSFTGGPFGSDLKSSDYTNSGVRIIQLQNIGDGCFLNTYKIYTSEEKADNLSSCNIFPNNIIIAKMADPVARACIMPIFDRRYLMASDGIRLEVDEKRFNVSFVKESINSPYFRSRAINLSTGTTRARIGLSALKSILIKYPLLNEQNLISQKIESIDKKIELEQTALNKYQKLKQGLMQNLLTGKVAVSV